VFYLTVTLFRIDATEARSRRNAVHPTACIRSRRARRFKDLYKCARVSGKRSHLGSRKFRVDYETRLPRSLILVLRYFNDQDRLPAQGGIGCWFLSGAASEGVALFHPGWWCDGLRQMDHTKNTEDILKEVGPLSLLHIVVNLNNQKLKNIEHFKPAT
jgi:hypothetical protein